MGLSFSELIGNTAKVTPYTLSKTGSSLDTLVDTPLVILWGHNPNETIFVTQSLFSTKMKIMGPNLLLSILVIQIQPNL